MDVPVIDHRSVLDEIIGPFNYGRSTRDSEVQTQLTTPPRPPTLGPGPHHLTFLGLPYELRLDIYERLLLAPDPIVASSDRRQLCVKVEPPGHQVAYLRAPRPRPRVVTLTHRKPHVEILQTCWQINHEATPILYQKNSFIAGLRLSGRGKTRIDSADLAGFFLYSLRPSTLAHLSFITFRGACYCDQWLALPARAGYSTTGNELGRVCAGGWEYLEIAYLIISNALWDLEKDFGRLRVCAFCNASHGQHFVI